MPGLLDGLGEFVAVKRGDGCCSLINSQNLKIVFAGSGRRAYWSDWQVSRAGGCVR